MWHNAILNLMTAITTMVNHKTIIIITTYRKNHRINGINKMQEITLDKLINYLGQPHKKIGKEYVWQCPYCQDTGMDNLKYNDQKGVLFCFANDNHSRAILSDMFKFHSGLHAGSHKKPLKTIVNAQNAIIDIYTKDVQKKFSTELLTCNKMLLNDEKSLKFLYEKRGLTKETVDFCKIGINKEKKVWVIPTFKYNCEKVCISGFEYRPADLSKNGLYRTKNTPNSLAMINCYTPQVEALSIIEGYFDGYALYQYLKEKGQADYYHIVTPSNGVNSLFKYIPQIDFNRYKKCYLYIDNDKPSLKVLADIVEKYPIFEVIKMTCGCKDFNEHYLQCIKRIQNEKIKTNY